MCGSCAMSVGSPCLPGRETARTLAVNTLYAAPTSRGPGSAVSRDCWEAVDTDH